MFSSSENQHWGKSIWTCMCSCSLYWSVFMFNRQYRLALNRLCDYSTGCCCCHCCSRRVANHTFVTAICTHTNVNTLSAFVVTCSFLISSLGFWSSGKFRILNLIKLTDHNRTQHNYGYSDVKCFEEKSESFVKLSTNITHRPAQAGKHSLIPSRTCTFEWTQTRSQRQKEQRTNEWCDAMWCDRMSTNCACAFEW